MGRTDFLFEMPSFLNGAARTLDLGGLYDHGAYLVSATPREADERALANDWSVIGKDLGEAMDSPDKPTDSDK